MTVIPSGVRIFLCTESRDQREAISFADIPGYALR
jgi:hypothetical protein